VRSSTIGRRESIVALTRSSVTQLNGLVLNALLRCEVPAASLPASPRWRKRRNVMGKDRLKNEMLRKIRETKLSLLAMTEDQLHSTTKRTIMENEHITSELQYQRKASETITAANATVAAENKVEAKAAAALKTTLRTQQAKTAQLRGKLASVEIEMEKLTAQCLETEQRFSAAKAEVGEARAAARALDTTPKVCVQVHVAADAAVSHTEEETSLRDENAKLRAENARLLGHHNTHQRIHYVQKMKKENVLLAAKLEEEREGSRKLKKILKAYQTASTLEVVSET
jgi:hypothetical protein